MERLAVGIRLVFPFPAFQTAEAYVKYHAALANTEAAKILEKKAENTTLKNLRELLAHALRYEAAEQERGNSIATRAQALLVAQTFFGALLAFSTAIVGRTELFSGWLLLGLLLLLGYTLLLVVLLTLNALRATSGLQYRRIGTSDLLKWLPKPEAQLIRHMAVNILQNYRHASIVNTWRSMHLTYAQLCLRNIVLALGTLVVIVFYAGIGPGHWRETTSQTNVWYLNDSIYKAGFLYCGIMEQTPQA